MPGLVTTIDATDATFDDVIRLVEARYAPPMYERVESDHPDPVIVRVSDKHHGPVFLADEPRHSVLGFTLFETYGRDRLSSKVLQDSEIDEQLPSVLRFAVNPAGQLEQFKKFAAELPDWIAGLFPVDSEDYRLICGRVELLAPSSEISSRHIVTAELSLVRLADNQKIESRRTAIANFFGATESGRVNEPGRRLGRPFDEIAITFRRSVGQWLSTDVPASLRASSGSAEPTISQVLQLDEQ